MTAANAAHAGYAAQAAPAVKPDAADDALLDRLQRRAFDYFLQAYNPRSGLVADTSREGAPASIAVIGFALSAYPVAVERGWMERADAVQRTLVTLRFLMASDQTGSAQATGYRGFYFHFLDMERGTRVWHSEVSLIDTGFLMAGVLTAAAYFDAGASAGPANLDTAATADEIELRRLAEALYRRVDWCWAQREGGAVTHGWKPECGFLNYGWEGYSEALLLYVLGLGSPTHPLTDQSFAAWTVTYQWENLYGHDFLVAGPLFIHQFSHAWIDFRGIRDVFMREKNCDYFENSRRATYVQREYASRNPGGFAGYGADSWGLSAGEGPQAEARRIAGRQQTFYGYAARGVPYGPDDGTLCASATLSSLVFTPELVLPALRALASRSGTDDERFIQASGFNPTLAEAGPNGWISAGEFGLDQGMIVLMIENYRSGLLWRLGRANPVVQKGLRRAGFKGGWL